jgi:hypothetical protein
MNTRPVGARAAATIEAAGARAWADLYAVAPADFAETVGLGFREVAGGLVLRWAATGRRYFSRAIGPAVIAPATEADIDDILAGAPSHSVRSLRRQRRCLARSGASPQLPPAARPGSATAPRRKHPLSFGHVYA